MYEHEGCWTPGRRNQRTVLHTRSLSGLKAQWDHCRAGTGAKENPEHGRTGRRQGPEADEQDRRRRSSKTRTKREPTEEVPHGSSTDKPKRKKSVKTEEAGARKKSLKKRR